MRAQTVNKQESLILSPFEIFSLLKLHRRAPSEASRPSFKRILDKEITTGARVCTKTHTFYVTSSSNTVG